MKKRKEKAEDEWREREKAPIEKREQEAERERREKEEAAMKKKDEAERERREKEEAAFKKKEEEAERETKEKEKAATKQKKEERKNKEQDDTQENPEEPIKIFSHEDNDEPWDPDMPEEKVENSVAEKDVENEGEEASEAVLRLISSKLAIKLICNLKFHNNKFN